MPGCPIPKTRPALSRFRALRFYNRTRLPEFSLPYLAVPDSSRRQRVAAPWLSLRIRRQIRRIGPISLCAIIIARVFWQRAFRVVARTTILTPPTPNRPAV